MISGIADQMAEKFGYTKNLPIHPKQVINNSKVSDHHAIIPTANVQKRMAYYLENGYKIEVRILKEVEYVGDSFIQDANRLALAELEEIVNQQSKGFCITDDMLSEAVKKKSEEKAWNDLFREKKYKQA